MIVTYLGDVEVILGVPCSSRYLIDSLLILLSSSFRCFSIHAPVWISNKSLVRREMPGSLGYHDVTTDPRQAFITAISAGDVATVGSWLTQGYGPDDVSEGLSPLFAAVTVPSQEAAAQLVQALLDAGWPADARDSRSNTPLLTAAARGNSDVVGRLLAANADANASNAINTTPLTAALNAASPDGDTIHLLLEAGADVNHKPLQGSCPLFITCRNSKVSSYLPALLEMEVDVTRLEQGATALHVACSHLTESRYIVHLIEAGCDVNVPDARGCTPLQRALLGPGDVEVARALLKHGADVNCVDSSGRTLMHHFVTSGANTVRILQDLGCECYVNARDDNGFTPLHVLCSSKSCSAETLQGLLSWKPDVNLADAQGRTALHHMCQNHNCSLSTLTLLIESGCDVNAEDLQGVTAFHLLCENIVSPVAMEAANRLLQAGFNQALLEPVHLRIADCWESYGLAARHACLMFAGIPASHQLYRWRLTSLLQYPASLESCGRSAVSPLEFALLECRHVANKGQGRLADPNDILWQLTCLLDIIHLYVATGTLQSTSDPLYKGCLNDVYEFMDHISKQPAFRTGYEVVLDSVLRCQNLIYSLTSYTSGACKLLELCRVRIYILLFPSPRKKVNALNIPKRMKEYIVFKDLQ